MKLCQKFSKKIFNNIQTNLFFKISLNDFSSKDNYKKKQKRIDSNNDNSNKNDVDKTKILKRAKDNNVKNGLKIINFDFENELINKQDPIINSIIKDLTTKFERNTPEYKRTKQLKKKLKRLSKQTISKASRKKLSLLSNEEVEECKNHAILKVLNKEKRKRERKTLKSNFESNKEIISQESSLQNKSDDSSNALKDSADNSKSTTVEKRKIYNQKILKLAITRLMLSSNQYKFKKNLEDKENESVKDLSVVEDNEGNESNQTNENNIHSDQSNLNAEKNEIVLDENTKKEINQLNEIYNNIPFLKTDYTNYSLNPVEEWKKYKNGKIEKMPIVNRINTISKSDKAKINKINDNKINPKFYKIHSIYEGDVVKVISGEFADRITKVTSIRRSNNDVYLNKVNSKLVRLFSKKFRRVHLPISKKDIKLISPFTNKPTTPEIVKRDDGTYYRRCPETKKEIPVPIVKRNRIFKDGKIIGIKTRKVKTNKKCTKSINVKTVTFKGYEYEDIAKDFILRMKEKKAKESLLILKDKINIEKNVLI